MKILVLADIAAPYRVAVFKGLAEVFDTTVFFNNAKSETRDPKWFAKSGRDLEFYVLNTPEAVEKYEAAIRNIQQYDAVLCYAPWHKRSMALQRLCMRKKIPYAINADGALHINTRFPYKQVKSFYTRRATVCFAGCHRAVEYFKTYGAKEKNIVRHPFTSLYADQICAKPYTQAERDAYKQELGIAQLPTFITVGQFIPRKGFDLLLKAWEKTKQNAQLYIIGGGPCLEEYQQIIEENSLRNIHLIGFMTPDELRKYYRAADIYVMPTREDIWGLVVNEAMAEGLPIITSNQCTSGNELVKNGENGYIYPCEDTNQLAAYIQQFADSPDTWQSFSQKALDAVREYTFENIIKSHIESIENMTK